MSYTFGNTGNNMIDGDDGSDSSSPNYISSEHCMYCGCRIDRLNYTSYDEVCEDCLEEHEEILNETDDYEK